MFSKPFVIISLLFPFVPPHAWTPEAGVEKPIGKADAIRVDKSERRLELLRRGRVIAAVPVTLGGLAALGIFEMYKTKVEI